MTMKCICYGGFIGEVNGDERAFRDPSFSVSVKGRGIAYINVAAVSSSATGLNVDVPEVQDG